MYDDILTCTSSVASPWSSPWSPPWSSSWSPSWPPSFHRSGISSPSSPSRPSQGGLSPQLPSLQYPAQYLLNICPPCNILDINYFSSLWYPGQYLLNIFPPCNILDNICSIFALFAISWILCICCIFFLVISWIHYLISCQITSGVTMPPYEPREYALVL